MRSFYNPPFKIFYNFQRTLFLEFPTQDVPAISHLRSDNFSLMELPTISLSWNKHIQPIYVQFPFYGFPHKFSPRDLPTNNVDKRENALLTDIRSNKSGGANMLGTFFSPSCMINLALSVN